MSLHNRIKEARKNKGMTQTELGIAIGVAKTTIAGYEKSSEPTAAQLGEIADVLDVDITFLLQDEIKRRRDTQATQEEMETLIKKYRLLDPYGKEAVDSVLDVEYRRYETDRRTKTAALREEGGEEMEAAEEITYFIVPYYLHPSSAGTGQEAEDDEPEDLVLRKRPPRGTSFVIRVSGHSMEPTFYNGEKLFVRAQVEVRKGEIGIFFMDGQQWVKELGDGELIPHNPGYKPCRMTDDVRCQGLVLGVCDESYF